jgi:hypothetical protein
MTGKLAWSLAALAAPVFAFAVVAGCSSSAPVDSPQNKTMGTIEAALSSVGTDGFTYSIPASDVLIVSGTPTGGSFVQMNCFPITATPTMSTALPVGTYTVSLATTCSAATPDAAAESFTLQRGASDGGVTSVNATLTNPAQSVVISQGVTTNLIFQFAISQTASVTMGTGTLTTGITTIDGGAMPPTHATWIATYSGWSFSGTDAGAPVAALFGPGSPDAGGTITVTTTAVQPFTAYVGDYASANFYNETVTFTSTNTGLTALAQELSQANGTFGNFQLYDQNVSPPGSSTMTETYLGTPVSMAFQSTGLCNSGAGCEFSLRQGANINPPLYNGAAVNAGAFATPVSLPGSYVVAAMYVGNGTTYLGSVLFNVTSSTLQLTP